MTSDARTPIKSRRRGTLLGFVAFLVVAVIVATPFIFRLFHPAAAAILIPTTQPTTHPVRSIVFIVPGTYGNEGFWPNVIPGKATFASELQRAMAGDAVIYPCLWYAANDHANREAAAKQVATVIDEKSAGFEKVFLVGHSHGGNVALLAAGLAKHKVDAVICLSTPHVYLVVQQASNKPLELPVYCTLKTRQNTGKIVAACADADNVPDVWADAVNGVDDNAAIALTREWQEQNNHPRLKQDGFWAHTFGEGNVKVGKALSAADANVTIRSFIEDRLGIAPHYASHSRRMGYVVGSLLRDGCSTTSVDYLRSLVQPANSDSGGPVDEAEQAAWVKQNEPNFETAGWRLDHASIKLDPNASKAARNTAGSTPEPYLRIQTAGDHKTLYESKTIGRSFAAEWDSDFILWRGPAYQIGVYAQHNWKRDTTLGNRGLAAGATPPAACPVDVANGIYWSGDFVWSAVHY